MPLPIDVMDRIVERMLNEPAPPKAVALGCCDWPADVFDAFMAQDPATVTHHVPPFTVRALDGRELAACGVPVSAGQIAPAETQPTCIACAIACGTSPESFLTKAVA